MEEKSEKTLSVRQANLFDSVTKDLTGIADKLREVSQHVFSLEPNLMGAQYYVSRAESDVYDALNSLVKELQEKGYAVYLPQ